MKVKSESEVAQSCRTLSDPMDCSLPGSSVHGISQSTGGVCHCLLRPLSIHNSFLAFCSMGGAGWGGVGKQAQNSVSSFLMLFNLLFLPTLGEASETNTLNFRE